MRDVPEPDGAARRRRATPVLELDEVSFDYGRAPVLRDAWLCLHSAEFVAVTGSNGSGKTTLLRLALGLLRPQSGTVRLFGTRLESFTEWSRVGYVPQRAVTNTALPISVGEVVKTGLAGAVGLWRRPSAQYRRRVDHVLDLMGLADRRHEAVARLSGGQQQRALIARALVTGPELLILDEPTTGVDAQARTALRQALEHLVDVEGMAVVYVSHDPEGFDGLADRVVAVSAGRLVETPAHGHGTRH